MFCINCGKQIVDTARFCNYCGVKVVDFDEKIQQNPAEIPENPLPNPAEDVKISENVENSVDLLKMQNAASPDTTLMNEQPEDSDTPFTEKEATSLGIQSGAVGAQRGADVPTTPEQLDVNIPISRTPGQSPTGAIPGQLAATGTTPEQSEPVSPPLGQAAPITQTPGQSPTGAIPGQLAATGTTPEQSEPISTPLGQSAPITPTAEPPKQTERRYTLGHIIMCLASTALMAIAAGVFAGLYFSVV